jgi:hypothetical protein
MLSKLRWGMKLLADYGRVENGRIAIKYFTCVSFLNRADGG